MPPVTGPGKRFTHTQVVSAEKARRTTAVDLLSWTEERVMMELVRAVYKAGYVGTAWPELVRVPMKLVFGQPTVEEWRITATVRAVPRE